MSKNIESKSIEQLMAEADELMNQINSDFINTMKEEHRLEFEKHTQNFKKMKSEVHSETGKTELSEMASSTEGMHEAIQDIVKSFRELTKFLSY